MNVERVEAGQMPALGQVPGGRPKGLLDTAVRCRGQHDEVLIFLCRDFTKKLVALVLALIASGWGRRTVSFIHDNELRAVQQE